VSAIMAASPADVPVAGDETGTPKPAKQRALLQTVLAAVAGLLLAGGAGLVLLPSLLDQPAAGIGSLVTQEHRAWRVSDRDSAFYFDNLLQNGWRVERADTDNWGTTYVVQRAPLATDPVPTHSP
jgi:hypothetical protein